MKFRATSSTSALMLYLLLLIGWVAALWFQGESMWYLGLLPWYGLGLIFLVRGTRYIIDGEKLFVKNPMEHKRYGLDEIKTILEVNNPFWKSMLLAIPQTSLKVATEKGDIFILHPADPEELKLALKGKINT